MKQNIASVSVPIILSIFGMLLYLALMFKLTMEELNASLQPDMSSSGIIFVISCWKQKWKS